ncbi:MAG: LamG domain-containing protein [Verrucomicrobia bacterium]|nr:LamG domain-containing protein [Verrucomicrobiota bacterium]
MNPSRYSHLRLLALLLGCWVGVAIGQAEITPVLDYRLGEDDSPNTLGGPATDPTRARLGDQHLTRRGSPQYVPGYAAIGSTHAIRLTNGPGIVPQSYGTDFDFDPTESGQWGFSCWVKFDALPDPDKAPEAAIVHIGDINAGSIILQTLARDGRIVFGTHAPGIAINAGETEVHLGRWTHLAVVFDNGGRMYVDGYDEAAVGGGQNPPAGITLGAIRSTATSFGSHANITIDQVRVFEVPPWGFQVSDLEIPPVTGPYIVSSTGGPFGFTIEIADNFPATLDPATLSLKVNGADLTPTSVTKPGNTLVEYQRPVDNPFPAGVYGIEIGYRDTGGQSYTDARSFRVRSYTLLPADFLTAAGTVNKTQPGFRIRPHQVAAGQPNSLKWTEEQLAGVHGPNLANLTGAVEGYFVWDSIIDFKNETGQTANFFNDLPFSAIGIPGTTLANEDNAAIEVLTFLEFPAVGFYSLGVNSDDGFRLSTGLNARDRLSVVVGEYDGDRLAADSILRIYVPQAGIYPFRLIWENGTGPASLEWFSVLEDGTRALINDPAVPGAILAYRAGPNPAYVSAVSPIPGETAARADAAITVEITDGETTVAETSVQLGLNGPAVAPTSATKTGGVITATLVPPAALAAGSTNTITLVYADNTGKNFTHAWTFRVAEAAGGVQLITPSGITQKAGDTLGGFPVANLINNSGFSTPPDAGNYATTSHTASGNTWVTATAANPNYFTAGHPAPQFDLTLGSLFDLSHLVVWGYGGNNNEATDFTVEFSTDGGAPFTGSESVQTSALLGGNSEALEFTQKHTANAVRITMTNNGGGRGFGGAGTGDRVGLGEIKFLGTAVVVEPPARPTLSATRAGGNVTLSWPASVTGFTLETSERLPATTWTPVPGVANNSVTLPTSTAASSFYRLRSP